MYDPNDMEKSFQKMAWTGLAIVLAVICAAGYVGYLIGGR